MNEPEAGPRARSAPELKDQIEAERLGRPFLVYRDGGDEQRMLMIEDGIESSSGSGAAPRPTSASTGTPRSRACTRSSSSSALDCTLVDDGLSRNGSFVNGERVGGRRRLRDGDMLRFGRDRGPLPRPARRAASETVLSGDALTAAGVSPAQKRVLVALCRPFKDGSSFATPATNGRDRRASCTSASTRSRPTCGRCSRSSGSRTLPQNRKRVALVERALQTGLVTEREL